MSAQCANHNPVQHRDGCEPWCRECGLNENYTEPLARFPKKEDPEENSDEIFLSALFSNELTHDEKIRLACLEEANRDAKGYPPHVIITRAEAYFKFIKGEEK